MPELAAAVLGVVLLDQHVLAAAAEPSPPLRTAAGTAAVLVVASTLASLASALLPRDAAIVIAATLAVILATPATRTSLFPGVDPVRVAASAVILAAAVIATHRAGAAATFMRALAAGAGFVLASAGFAAVRERLRDADVPASLRGAAIAVVTVAIACLALAGVEGVAPG
jgi:electron transport complex protein RnfA